MRGFADVRAGLSRSGPSGSQIGSNGNERVSVREDMTTVNSGRETRGETGASACKGAAQPTQRPPLRQAGLNWAFLDLESSGAAAVFHCCTYGGAGNTASRRSYRPGPRRPGQTCRHSSRSGKADISY